MRSDSLLAVEVLALAIAVGTVTAIPVYAALRLIDQRPLTNNARVALGLIQPFVLVIGLLALFKALPDAMTWLSLSEVGATIVGPLIVLILIMRSLAS